MDFFRNIFKPFSRPLPQKVAKSLPVHFAGAKGIEWIQHDGFFEAIFFHEEIEKIAKFDTAGNLLEYRVNISPDSIPSPIREAVDPALEIMNCISVYTSERLTWELIVRDKKLSRYKLLLDSLGNRIAFELL